MADTHNNEFIEQLSILKAMFGDTVAEDVISAVLESCNGDVNVAADAIMNMSHDNDTVDLIHEPNISEARALDQNKTPQPIDVPPALNKNTTANEKTKQSASTSSEFTHQVDTLSTSFAEAFRTGTVSKKAHENNPTKLPNRHNNVWSEDLQKILRLHNDGTRALILLRGAPGCGKTYLAKYIVDATVGPSPRNYETHIFSSDNYFMRGGVYQFDRNYLDVAHMTNQRKVCNATNRGVSPVIVDNTNIALWEMEPYLRDGIQNGYVILIVEPNTTWAKNVNQLSKRNVHNVPWENIRRMLDNYERCTVESLMKGWRLAYPSNMRPPVKRCIPAFTEKSPSPPVAPKNPPMQPIKKEIPAAILPDFAKPPPAVERKPAEPHTLNKVEYYRNTAHSTTASASNVEVVHHKIPNSPDKQNQAASVPKTPETSSDNDQEAIRLQKIIEAQKNLELLEKLDKEWEAGASWDATTNDTQKSESRVLHSDPKPPRAADTNVSENFIKPSNICEDWTKITAFMPPWHDDKSVTPSSNVEEIPVEMTDAATSIEISDLHGGIHKVLFTNSRNINEMFNTNIFLKKPTKIMIDKSTSTHEYEDYMQCVAKCKNSEQHFRAFRRMFSTVPCDILRDVFDSCRGDVNWAVNIVLDSYPDTRMNKRDETKEKNDSLSDSDNEEPVEDCNCLAAYNIIPNFKSNAPVSPVLPAENLPQSSPAAQKKPKRETILSESSKQLKRQIESNVMISDDHYSQHYLNTRRRRDENNAAGQNKSSNIHPFVPVPADVPEEIPEEENARALPQNNMQYNFEFEDSDSEFDKNESRMVSVDIGHEFRKKLDGLFGMEEFSYPENIKPIVNMPLSLLREINAYWQESLAFQLEDQVNQSEAMIKQDEEFARQLQAKEQEMCRVGQKPEMPSLKEIMDMELAYSIYEKNVSEWRNKEPQDMASRLSREKLFNLFPDFNNEILSELLMAHEYNFKETVEALLISTGRPDTLEEENGVEKFVMAKELERKEKFLEQEKKNLAESVWPFANEPDRPITLETVEYYRAEADKALNNRNINFNKARTYFERNIPSAATFFSDIAALHTKKYEQNSALAAAYLMTYHMNKNPSQDVVDLHFLRVTEALITMDIFIDKIIMQVRENNLSGKMIYIITGRGQHSSNGAPRIKPAAKRRLKARDIYYREINPGLLAGTLKPSHKMTNEL